MYRPVESGVKFSWNVAVVWAATPTRVKVAAVTRADDWNEPRYTSTWRERSAACTPSFRTSIWVRTIVPAASVNGRRMADTARSFVASCAMVAVIDAALAEMSRTRQPVTDPSYARLSGVVSGPHPAAVSCHGSPESVGRSPDTPSSASSRSSKRWLSCSFVVWDSSTCQINRPLPGRAASKPIGCRFSMRKYSKVVPGRFRRNTFPDVSTASIAVPTSAVVTSVGVTHPSLRRDQALMWAGLEPAGAPVQEPRDMMSQTPAPAEEPSASRTAHRWDQMRSLLEGLDSCPAPAWTTIR